MSRVTSIYDTYAGHNTSFRSRIETGHPMGARGPAIDVFYINGGRSRTFDTAS
jgi:hypothetical protein